ACKKCCNMVPSKSVLLHIKKIKAIIKEAKEKLGIRTVVFIGEGETTLAPNFKTIISYAETLGLYKIIFTNGYYLDEKLANFLVSKNASIVFSVDSLQKNKYEYLTGTKGSFDRVMQNIEYCRKIYSGKACTRKGKRVVMLAMNVLITATSKMEAKQIFEFCGNDIKLAFNYPVMKGNAQENAGLFECNLKTAKKNYSVTNYTPRTGNCGYFFNGITFGIDGSLLACPYTLEMTGKTVNIFDTDIETAVKIHDQFIKQFRKVDDKFYCVIRSSKYKKFITGI
ncbi:MAG: radical SAM protein, partial [Candidatus Diapherotrites archaeon]|nr:radical SAM protein [Candidatus Diapherotrites archaeon]